jgi:TonB family protein
MQGASARPYPFVVIAPPEMQKYFKGITPPREVPYEVKRNGWSGTGTFRVKVDASGRVTHVAVVKTTGHRVLDEALISGVRGWRARPGKPREIDFPLTVLPPPRGMPSPGL